jgi:glyoxylase-like metal-dependent hydrolase (beta-lactamase superfamily II)
MIGRVLVGLAVLFSIALLWAGGGLAWAHLELWRLRPPLPDANEIAALGDAPDAPVRLWWWNLEWTNGRRLLIDAGMSRSAAERFAAPIVQAGGTPPVVRESLAERLGAAAGTLAGALFSHLHTDHVEGMGELCKARSGAPLPVFQTPDQARRSNYTTRAGRDLLEAAGCAAPHELPDLALAPVPGFAGVAVVAGAGHTPGSQIVLAALAEGGERRLLAFTGDVANHVDGIRLGVPKPILYRTLMVPESEGRLARLRDWLAELERGGATLLVAHDGLHLETLGIPELPEPAPPTPSALLRVP